MSTEAELEEAIKRRCILQGKVGDILTGNTCEDVFYVTMSLLISVANRSHMPKLEVQRALMEMWDPIVSLENELAKDEGRLMQ